MNKGRPQLMWQKSGWPLLLLALLAPACSPKETSAEPEKPPKHLVLLTDAERWPADRLTALKDSLRHHNFRVIVSGYPGERTDELLARLPWLLQPGIDLLLCDPNFISPHGMDSLKAFLEERGRPIRVAPL